MKPRNNPKDVEDVENLIDLPHLNEPEILSNLSIRYGKRQIYTYTGAILIAINPFDVLQPDPRYIDSAFPVREMIIPFDFYM